MNEFATNLRRIMFLTGIRQVDLADRIGVNKGNVIRWVKGENIPYGENLAKLAAALGVSVDVLLGEKELTYADFLPKPEVVREDFADYFGDEKVLIEAYRRSNEEQRRLVRYVLGIKDAQEGP